MYLAGLSLGQGPKRRRNPHPSKSCQLLSPRSQELALASRRAKDGFVLPGPDACPGGRSSDTKASLKEVEALWVGRYAKNQGISDACFLSSRNNFGGRISSSNKFALVNCDPAALVFLEFLCQDAVDDWFLDAFCLTEACGR